MSVIINSVCKGSIADKKGICAGDTLVSIDKNEMNRIMEKTLQMVLLLSIPMCIGLIGIAENLIPVFLGDDFIDCIGLVRIFSLLIIIVFFIKKEKGDLPLW